MRLQKYLSFLGLASRREAEGWIREERLTVNGQTAVLGDTIDPDADQVALDGRLIGKKPPPRLYWLLHKPSGFLTSTKSQGDQPTLYDLPRLRRMPVPLVPAGRLDYLSEGLVLLTNDGEVCQRMTHPTHGWQRRYRVWVQRKVTPAERQRLKSGVVLDDGIARALIRQAPGGGSVYDIAVWEGRHHLVRRLLGALDIHVLRLMRTGHGPLKLPADLKPGHYRQLTSDEIKKLRGFTPPPGLTSKEDTRETRHA